MKHTAIFIAAGLAFATVSAAAPAQAQNGRSFVSGHGLDTNNCTLAQPCRTFAIAFTHTNAGGEIDVLDPAGYGPVTITHAISIVNDGVGTSSILVPSGGDGVTINAGPADAVSLRGLTIEGAGVGQNGILFNTGASLTVENCVVRHVTGDGVAFFPSASSNLAISGTLSADNGDAAIYVHPSGSGIAVNAVLNRVELNSSGNNGLVVDGGISTGTVNVTVSESVAAGNNSVGFGVVTLAGHATATLALFHSVATNNGTGIAAENSGATLRAAQSMVTGNTTHGWSALTSGVVQSYGDNYIDGNGSPIGSLSSAAKQ